MTRFWQIWWFALIVKSVAAVALPMSADEAYYWSWGHHPQWSYFDHPPAVGWLMWLGIVFENFGSGARLPGVWLGHLTLVIWRKILTPFLTEKTQVTWLVLALFAPLLGPGSLIITPDVPLLFFWSLSLLCFMNVLKEHRTRDYAALGAALGLGFCSKYMIVLFVPCALGWLAYSGEWRRVRWTRAPITVVIGLIFCFPVLWWNLNHEWVSFRFQLDHGLNKKDWLPYYPVEYLAGQALLIFPTVLWFAFRRKEIPTARIFHFFAWFPMAFFFYTSFKAHVEANWPIMAYPSILSLAVLNQPSLRVLRSTIAVWLVALMVVLSQIVYPWLPIDEKNLKTYEFKRFDVFLDAARGPEPLFLGSYQAAAMVSFKLRRPFYKLKGANRRDLYDFLPQSVPNSDRFLFGAEVEQPLPDWLSEKGYVERSSRWLNSEFRLIEVELREKNPDR